jgi:hypothetical protein
VVETCPASAPSGPTYTAPSWSALHPGEVDFSSRKPQTVDSSAGNPAIAKAIDPIAGGGACATVSSADQGSGVATYRLPAATGEGYTLLGSPTVIANLTVTGNFPLIAERLWDVNPTAGTQTLVARGVYRLNPSKPNGPQVFQLHPGAWHFANGHIPKLELLGQDSPYARASNGKFSISVSDLQLRLPVHDAPGSSPQVNSPLPQVTPVSLARAAACNARPSSKITKRRTRASRSRIAVRGSAREHQCAFASGAARRRDHVRHVYVMVYQRAGHGHCRFLKRDGSLTATRSCRRAVRLRARGTRRWKLGLAVHLSAGRYVIRIDAVDAAHHHQRRTKASTQTVRLR